MTLSDLELSLKVNNQLNTDHIEMLINQAKESTTTMAYIIIGLLGLAIVIGVTIIWYQRKIKKMLRQMMEEQKKEKEDKPD